MGRQIRRVPRLPQPHGAERRAAHDALRPLRVHLPRRVGGVVRRGGLSGGNAVPPISSLSTVEGARPAVLETLRTGMVQSRLLRRRGLLAGFARWTDFGSIWSTWWMGDTVSDLVIAPAVLLWAAHPRVRWTRREALEAVALLACLAIVGITVFDGLVPWKDKHYPLEFLCVPLLLWAAFRFEQREAATVVLLLAGVAIWGTLRGYGPFARPLFNESLLLLQAFQGVSAVITLVLAAAVAERTEAVDRLRRLAVSDPLTGLSNYRQLAHALDAEIRRSSRTDRPFAVVLMDLDGLKKVNDRYGHLVGSMALRRVAEALLGSCRGIDTAARFGGDEFALVLPETGDSAAWHVARRVADRVARDGEQPPLSVSVGVAVHPRDGATLEALLNAADRSLYDTKARRHNRIKEPAR